MSLFDEQIARKPDHYPWTKDFVKALDGGFWTSDEFNFQSDVQDFKVSLTDAERETIIRALSVIGQVEIQVKEYWLKLGSNLPHPSIKSLGIVLANTERIHEDAYSKLLDVLGIEDSFEKILQLDIIKGRVNYLRKYSHKFHSDNKKQFIYSLILFSLFIENIALFSQFYTINWFGKFKNVLKDTNKQVDYTNREELLHSQVGIKLINVLRKEYPELFDQELEDKIIHEAKDAIRYEGEIIKWILNGFNHEFLNDKLLFEFIKNRMNESLAQIGYSKIFTVDSDVVAKTLWFDEQTLGNGMTDFFHSRPTEYAKKSQSFDESALF